eukprot:1452114-Rhodomonas_salina.2
MLWCARTVSSACGFGELAFFGGAFAASGRAQAALYGPRPAATAAAQPDVGQRCGWVGSPKEGVKEGVEEE